MAEPLQIALVVHETGAAAQQAFAYHVTVGGELVASSSALSPQQSQQVRELSHEFNRMFELRRVPQLAVEKQQAIGTALFEIWLRDLWPQIEAKCGTAARMLVIASSSPAVLNLPWELLRPDTVFAGCDLRLPIRRLPLRQNQLASLPVSTSVPPARPLEVLFYVCSPADLELLNYEKEEASLLAVVGGSDKISINFGDLGTFEELRERTEEYKPHVVHLTGHGIVTKRCLDCGQIAREPNDEQCWNCQTDLRSVAQEGFFAFEDERGRTDLQNGREIAQELFAGSKVQAVFISGCQSGKAPPIAAVGGLCAGLISQGMPLALGWAASIKDTLATDFAETFYKTLAGGGTFDRAAIQARQALRRTCDRQGDPSWALPLVYAATTQSQVFDTDQRRAAEPAPLTFDAQSPLPGIDEGYTPHFVGRRREIQRRLPDLRDGGLWTLVITGMGGVGKSTLATRLARKLEADGFAPIALPSRTSDPLSAALILQRCGDAFITAANQIAWQDPVLADFLRNSAKTLELADRTVEARLREVVNVLNRARFVLVIDNFETNLDSTSRAIIDPLVASFYRYLVENLSGGSRAIITSRYLPATVEPLPRTAALEPLDDFPYGSFLKLLLRDNAIERRYRAGELPRQLLRDLHRNLGGAPRFVEQLRALLQTVQATELQQSLNMLAAPAGDHENQLREAVDRYCETLIVPRLFDALTAEQQAALCHAAVFGVAVPPAGMAAAAQLPLEALQPMLGPWQQRAFAYPDSESGQQLWSIYGVLRPWLLAEERLEHDARIAAHKRAGDYLRDIESNDRERELGLTWTDCLLEARSQYLAAGMFAEARAMTGRISGGYLSRGLYPEIERLNREMLGHDEHAETHGWIGRAFLHRGSYQQARSAYDQALLHAKQTQNGTQEAATLHGLATIELREGNYTAARERFGQSLTIKQQIGDRAGEAATLHNLATIELREGNYTAARERFGQALTIKQQIGDRAGEAATFYQLGTMAARLQQVENGAALVALCYLIDRSIGHGDTQSDLQALFSLASQLNYTQEQFDDMLRRAVESYQADRGWGLVRAAFLEGNGAIGR